MGNSVFFPIDVKNNEVDLPFVAGKDAEWMRLQNLMDWEPTRSNPPVSLHLEVNPADNSYIPRSTWNGGQLMMRKTNSNNMIIDQGNMDRLRQNTEAAEAQYRAQEAAEANRLAEERQRQAEEEERRRLEEEEAQRAA